MLFMRCCLRRLAAADQLQAITGARWLGGWLQHRAICDASAPGNGRAQPGRSGLYVHACGLRGFGPSICGGALSPTALACCRMRLSSGTFWKPLMADSLQRFHCQSTTYIPSCCQCIDCGHPLLRLTNSSTRGGPYKVAKWAEPPAGPHRKKK
jgi:hypothetical protein